MGIAGEAMAAAVNPQLAGWSHSPFAVEAERLVITAFGQKFGIGDDADGCMTTGGAEANLSALLCALAKRWPEGAGARCSKHPRQACLLCFD